MDRQILTPTSANISTKTKNKAVSGGVIIYIKSNIPYANIASPNMNHIMAQSITIPLTQNKKLTITSTYIPQKATVTTQQDEDASITFVFTQLLDIPYSLIASDLNAHSPTWYAQQKWDHRGM